MKLNERTLEILEQSKINGNTLILTESLSRSDYVAVDKVLKTLGIMWNRKEKCHIASNPDLDIDNVISDIINTGEIIDPKKEEGFFPTPKEIVELLIQNSMLDSQSVILEPSSGDGAILKLIPNFVKKVYFVEFNKERYEQCLKIYPDGGIFSDFLNVSIPLDINRIIMNPPFAKQQDIQHVLHAVKDSPKGTRIVAIMSEGTFFRKNKKTNEFWEYINQYPNTTIDLPDKAFKSSGTNVKTRILIVQK